MLVLGPPTACVSAPGSRDPGTSASRTPPNRACPPTSDLPLPPPDTPQAQPGPLAPALPGALVGAVGSADHAGTLRILRPSLEPPAPGRPSGHCRTPRPRPAPQAQRPCGQRAHRRLLRVARPEICFAGSFHNLPWPPSTDVAVCPGPSPSSLRPRSSRPSVLAAPASPSASPTQFCLLGSAGLCPALVTVSGATAAASSHLSPAARGSRPGSGRGSLDVG